MSERGNVRGGSNGGHRNRGGERGRGGGRGGSAAAGSGEQKERPKKENIIDLNRFMDKQLRIKFNGGREVVGVLKGFDQLMNLVLDEVEEYMRDDEGNEETRPLGLVVARGTLLTMISPVDGSEEIENPFLQNEDE
ncbi:uncharacterized protein PV09_04226 [Verruconis gallopava]|uniref:Sm domain-containing protein n=1 Tax=Verruconis gallopava TaxID=253628 RepID=A0A0D2ADM4_9PEZI|nr:uncharacterized protein PV09_04226 [Verruconis gallopava]KIW05078.1 hypothetical protein PV09_04226 [Verruconis gallopava]